MSVHLRKDGYWIAKYLNPNPPPEYKVDYFGKGIDAEKKARARNDLINLLGYNKLSARKQPEKITESTACKSLARQLRGKYSPGEIQTEFKVKVGRIDILTPDEIIEVKKVSHWKAGIGQLLAYSKYFHDKHMRLHLFGMGGINVFEKALLTCKDFNIALTAHGGPGAIPRNIDNIRACRERRKKQNIQTPQDVERLRQAINRIPSLGL